MQSADRTNPSLITKRRPQDYQLFLFNILVSVADDTQSSFEPSGAKRRKIPYLVGVSST
jgi:hypothetical protein